MWAILTDTGYLVKTPLMYRDGWNTAVYETRGDADAVAKRWNELGCGAFGCNARPVPLPLIGWPERDIFHYRRR